MSDLTKIGSSLDSAKSRKRRPPRFANINEKKIADDEFMAAAIGDVEWLKQSLREAKGQINFDKNVRKIKKIFVVIHLAQMSKIKIQLQDKTLQE